MESSGLHSSQVVGETLSFGVWCKAGRLLALLFAAILAVTVTSLAYLRVPYFWISLSWAMVLLSATYASTRSWVKAIWLNLGIIVLSLSALEFYFWASEPPQRDMKYSDGVFVGHEILGYGPEKNRTLSHATRYGNELIYHVVYTINEDGLRIAEPLASPAREGHDCLLFFGDSFTFGEGVRDEDSMPYRVGKKLRGQYHVRNFGFLGYGPHQMLAALQQNLVDSVAQCRPRYAIYQAIPAHIARAAGLELWDTHGPKFVVGDNGVLVQKGHFDDERKAGLLERLRSFHYRLSPQHRHYFEKSALYRTAVRLHRPVDDHDIELFAWIVEAAKSTFEARYPGAEFHVIFWDFEDDWTVVEKAIDQLKRQGLRVHPISRILPGFPTIRPRYEISPYDRHPNVLAHERIAEYVANRIVDHVN